MMNKKFLALSTTAVAAALALAGCSTGTGSTATSSSAAASSSMPGMDHGSSGMMSSSSPTASTEHNAADTMFTQGMIPHHEQAVEMSEMILQKKDIPAAVTDLATRIKAAQAPEIDTMTGWLKSWNESATMSAGHSMDGMMGDDDLKKLDVTQGTEAAKLFLTQMIAHHEGAVMMAKTETAQGQNADAIKLSKNIVTAQEAEIQEMKNLLATL
ncbi:DUF305 domain-containing protein [Pseudarthrobacter sp. NPDC058196]|uniref:DUF305 domain-containing protein n=1 Tax=Pseudarthrobacter sp. NPDC058196 TaxID=3346376 RepID=UPI0036D75BD6